MLVRLCYVSLGMAVRNVSLSKSDLQGHWQWCHSIGHMRFPMVFHCNCVYLDRKRGIITYIPKFKEVTWLWTYAFWGIYYACTGTPVHQLAYEIWSSSFTDSKDMIGAKLNETGHVTNWGVVCHPKVSTWYIPHAYKIWKISLQAFLRCNCGCWNWKWVMWPSPRLLPSKSCRIWYSLPVPKIWRF